MHNPNEWVDLLELCGCTILKRAKPRIEDGNSKEGWQHIDERRVTGNSSQGPGDLFAPETTKWQLDVAAQGVVGTGTRTSAVPAPDAMVST